MHGFDHYLNQNEVGYGDILCMVSLCLISQNNGRITKAMPVKTKLCWLSSLFSKPAQSKSRNPPILLLQHLN